MGLLIQAGFLPKFCHISKFLAFAHYEIQRLFKVQWRFKKSINNKEKLKGKKSLGHYGRCNCWPKFLKSSKLNLPDFFFWAKWALAKFWRNLGQIPPISARQLWFLFFKAFCIWCKCRKSNLFAGLKQNHKVTREKDICPTFCEGADLRFQALYQAESYLALSNGHKKNRQQQKICG